MYNTKTPEMTQSPCGCGGELMVWESVSSPQEFSSPTGPGAKRRQPQTAAVGKPVVR